jgi:hypothetical protein
MKKIINLITYVTFILIVFPQSYSNIPIVGGDYTHLSKSYIDYFRNFSFSGWLPYLNLGWSQVGSLNNSLYMLVIGVVGQLFHCNALFTERLVWWLPFFVISYISVYSFKKILPVDRFSFLSYIIFIGNTYIIMILGGGQLSGVGLAYALFPLVASAFIQVFNDVTDVRNLFRESLWAGLIFGIQLMFDLRIAYMTGVFVILYFIFTVAFFDRSKLKSFIKNSFIFFIISLVVTFLIHAFWIIPALLFRINQLANFGQAYISADAVRYFSFGTFSQSLSLLHPNWPENIFGKVSFMKPEFLLIPTIAFSSLFFIKKEIESRKRFILFLAFTALLGSFLAKGSGNPFGGIYLWMFDHLPGFVMFREPTKWYILTIISYIILIPFAAWKIYELLKAKSKIRIFNFQNLFLILLFGYLLFLIKPALLGQLTGTFKPAVEPAEYIKLERILSSDKNFSRVLWVPVTPIFSSYSTIHPAVYAQDLFGLTDLGKIIAKISRSRFLMQESGVKYVIVPEDTQGEIFLKDRKYNEKIYLQTVNKVSSIKWLKKIDGFGKIAVYENLGYKDHFWSPYPSLSINYNYISPTMYSAEITNSKQGDILVFSESFDKNWVAESPNWKIQSSKFDGKFNSFILPSNGDYALKIYYAPQNYVNIGLTVSLIALAGTSAFLIFSSIKKSED